MFVFSQFAVYVGYGPAVYGAERRSARSADRKAMWVRLAWTPPSGPCIVPLYMHGQHRVPRPRGKEFLPVVAPSSPGNLRGREGTAVLPCPLLSRAAACCAVSGNVNAMREGVSVIRGLNRRTPAARGRLPAYARRRLVLGTLPGGLSGCRHAAVAITWP